MNDIIEFLLIIFSAYIIYRLVFYVTKRSFAMAKISKLKKECGAKIFYTRLPFLSYFKLSSKPDMVLEIGDTAYLVRFINGKGNLKFLHFASPKYFVTFSKMRISISSLFKIGGRYKNASASSTSAQSVKILPELKIPEKYTEDRDRDIQKAVPVLILSPVPNEVTFVSEARTSIKIAFVGDDVYGQKIFTPSTFVTYADRARREQMRLNGEYIWK